MCVRVCGVAFGFSVVHFSHPPDKLGTPSRSTSRLRAHGLLELAQRKGLCTDNCCLGRLAQFWLPLAWKPQVPKCPSIEMQVCRTPALGLLTKILG